LKKNVPVILLRNLDPTEGLCNSTRLIIKNCYKFLLDAKILTEVNKGKRIFIPQIRLSPSDFDLSFQLVRCQFPIKLSFAITINKAQD
ncbi:32251_t:CDS:1, partial [Gigaspora margarita]